MNPELSMTIANLLSISLFTAVGFGLSKIGRAGVQEPSDMLCAAFPFGCIGVGAAVAQWIFQGI